VRVRILQGPEKTVLKTLRPQRPNQLPPGNFEPIDIEPTEWYKRSQQGKKAVVLLETFNYTDDEDLTVEVGFRNSLTGEYVTTEKSFDAPAHMTAFDLIGRDSTLSVQKKELDTHGEYLDISVNNLEDCAKRCRSFPECAAFEHEGWSDLCVLHKVGVGYGDPVSEGNSIARDAYVRRRIARVTPKRIIISR